MNKMLSRLRIKHDFKYFIRCLSEKPPEQDSKIPEIKCKNAKNQDTSSESSTDKIQALLKSMMAKPTISDTEYRQRFTTAPERPKKTADEVEVKTEKIEESITKAAQEVAQAIGGNVKQTEAELLSKVLGKINQTSTSLSDLIVGMQVDRSRDSEEPVHRETRGQQVKRLVDRTRFDQTRYNQRKYASEQLLKEQPRQRKSLPQSTTVNIFSGEALGIFSIKGEPNYGTTLEVWEELNKRELVLATSQPPTNYFQKMVLWTEQGKVWKFPINNEQDSPSIYYSGVTDKLTLLTNELSRNKFVVNLYAVEVGARGMEEEQNVHFSEHIFLDSHLEGWCPSKGPVRHFMELVCVGLSKNAFYTVQEKQDHIMWYKEYFESKKDMLQEIGVWATQDKQTDSETSH